jgi:putative flippase GtrA
MGSFWRQISVFFGVGVLAMAVQYGVLIGLVELAGSPAVPATLAGYAAGGVLSYVMNRRHTFESVRPHAEATWRFGLVAAVGFSLTGLIMYLLVNELNAPYLPAQVATTAIVFFWNFVAHRGFTFARDGLL